MFKISTELLWQFTNQCFFPHFTPHSETRFQQCLFSPSHFWTIQTWCATFTNVSFKAMITLLSFQPFQIVREGCQEIPNFGVLQYCHRSIVESGFHCSPLSNKIFKVILTRLISPINFSKLVQRRSFFGEIEPDWFH